MIDRMGQLRSVEQERRVTDRMGQLRSVEQERRVTEQNIVMEGCIILSHPVGPGVN